MRTLEIVTLHTYVDEERPAPRALRVLALVSVLANVAFNGLYEHLGLGLANVRDVSDQYRSLFTPAHYAFAIWGVIYTALIGYAIFALLPSQRAVRVHDRVALPFIAMNVLGSVWIATFTSDHVATSVLVLAAMLASAMLMVRRVFLSPETRAHRQLWLAPFSLLTGWLSVAAIANVSQAAVAYGATAKDVGWAVVMLGVALVVALLVAVRFADAVFLAVVCWAAAAIAVAQLPISVGFGVYAIVIAVLSGACSLGIAALLWRHRVDPTLA